VIDDRIKNLNKLKEWMQKNNLGNDPNGFKFKR